MNFQMKSAIAGVVVCILASMLIPSTTAQTNLLASSTMGVTAFKLGGPNDGVNQGSFR